MRRIEAKSQVIGIEQLQLEAIMKDRRIRDPVDCLSDLDIVIVGHFSVVLIIELVEAEYILANEIFLVPICRAIDLIDQSEVPDALIIGEEWSMVARGDLHSRIYEATVVEPDLWIIEDRRRWQL